jgi:hypothetical protein
MCRLLLKSNAGANMCKHSQNKSVRGGNWGIEGENEGQTTLIAASISNVKKFEVGFRDPGL